MADVVEFMCPTTNKRCFLLDGYSAFLMSLMDASVVTEAAIAEPGKENPGLQATIDQTKAGIADMADLDAYAEKAIAVATGNNCPGPQEYGQDFEILAAEEPIYLMATCPMRDFIQNS